MWAAVAMAESSGSTTVVNSIGCVGLWQINQPVHVKSHPTWTVRWLQDPVNNAKAAKVIHASQGWRAWEAYTGPDGVGSDGPWKTYYKGGGKGGATQAFDPWDPLDILPEGSTDKLGEAPILGGLDDVATGIAATAEAVQKAGSWLGNSKNWVRIGYVVGGSVLVIVGAYIVAAPLVGKAAASTPMGQAVQKVAGKAKGKVSAARATRSKAKSAAAKTPAKKESSSDE